MSDTAKREGQTACGGTPPLACPVAAPKLPMVENLLDEQRKKELDTLRRSFESFNEVTRQLQSSYDTLQLRIKELDLELAKKNEELERNLGEKDQVKNYLNDILESLSTGVIVIDREQRITVLNKSAENIAARSSTDCLGAKLETIFPAAVFEKCIAPLIHSVDKARNVDATLFPENRGKMEIRLSASPMLDNAGEQIGTALIVQDITELKRLEDEVQRNQRMKAMGEMAAGIAHEIRNPLGSIELFASLLRKDLEGEVDKQILAEHICAGVKNMDRIISSILLFAKSPEPSRQKCKINGMLNELLEFSSNIIYPNNIKIVRKLAPGELLGNGDADLLKQVFLNLIRNAIQAMQDGGELCLSTLESVEKRPELERDRRRFIAITISDTGMGISPENLAKIFNPFFTTKDHGTGLGLAIAHNIIKAHQGTIEVESQLGKGTTFSIKIPAWEG